MPVFLRSRLRRPAIHRRRILSLAQQALAAAGEPEAELSLELVGNDRIRGLNRQYRRQDAVTDVLAFPTREGPGPRTALLGDVVICVPRALHQARHYGHAIEEELVRLLIHGMLHLLGYDHEIGEREARRMRRKEQAILHRLRPLPTLASSWARSLPRSSRPAQPHRHLP